MLFHASSVTRGRAWGEWLDGLDEGGSRPTRVHPSRHGDRVFVQIPKPTSRPATEEPSKDDHETVSPESDKL